MRERRSLTELATPSPALEHISPLHTRSSIPTVSRDWSSSHPLEFQKGQTKGPCLVERMMGRASRRRCNSLKRSTFPLQTLKLPRMPRR